MKFLQRWQICLHGDCSLDLKLETEFAKMFNSKTKLFEELADSKCIQKQQKYFIKRGSFLSGTSAAF